MSHEGKEEKEKKKKEERCARASKEETMPECRWCRGIRKHVRMQMVSRDLQLQKPSFQTCEFCTPCCLFYYTDILQHMYMICIVCVYLCAFFSVTINCDMIVIVK